MCVGALKDFLEYLEMVSEGAMAGNIQELHGLMSRKTVCRKSGSTGGRIWKQLIRGDKQIPETQVRSARIREAFGIS